MRTVWLITLFFSFFSTISLNAQLDVIELINPSFEDIPHAGQMDIWGRRSQISGWQDCSEYFFPDESPPDIHPNNFWDVKVAPSHGKTYLGMVVRRQESWESVSQAIAIPIKEGSCYQGTIELARSDNYWSATKEETAKASRLNLNKVRKENFTQPALLRIWGGPSKCNDKQLLWESTPIDHSDWREYAIQFEAKARHSYITLEAWYKTPNLVPYNGHILLDNMSVFTEVKCNDPVPNEVLAVVPTQEKPKTKIVPQHLRRKAKKTTNTEVASNTDNKNKRIIKDLEREGLKIGQTIEISNLYFEANKSEITNTSYAVLDELYTFMNQNSDMVIEIGGHTNSIPKHAYCDRLSKARAKAIAKYLVDKGIEARRVQFKGYGKRNPIASNDTVEGRKKNQRVEIKILSFDS